MNYSEIAEGEKLLRLGEVLARFPVSRTTWYEGIKQGIYPAPIKLGARSTAWRSSDIDALIHQRANQGRQQ